MDSSSSPIAGITLVSESTSPVVLPLNEEEAEAWPPGLTDYLKSWIRKEVQLQVQAEIRALKTGEPSTVMAGTSDTFKPSAAEQSLEPKMMRHSWIVGEAVHGELEREIEGTAWEAPVLAFMEGLSFYDSITIIFSSVTNIAVQLIVVYILLDKFLTAKLPLLSEVENWRMVHGHDQNNYLEVPESSLVSAVCSGDKSLIVSTVQQTLFGTITAYNADMGGSPMGAVLCVVVLFIWFLECGREVSGSISLITSLLSIVSGKTELQQVSFDSDRPFVLKSVSRLRMVLAALVAAIRLLVALALLMVGSIWLSNTLSIDDMVLNAAALTFILEIDELIFKSFASVSSKALLNNLQPLKRPAKALWVGQAFSFFGSIILVAVMIFFFVAPNISKMENIKAAMCGGNQDFIIGPSAWGLHFGTETKAFNGSATSFGMEIVKEAWESDAETIVNNQKWTGKWSFMASFGIFKMGTSYFENPQTFVPFYGNIFMRTCDDFPLSERDSMFQETLEYQTGIANVSSCSVAASHCGQTDMPLLRMLCPVTCGCRDPLSGLYRDGPSAGCPVGKCRQSKAYKAVLDSLPCADMEAASLAADPRWKRFWDGAIAFRRDKEEWTGIKNAFMADGCSAYASLSVRNKGTVCIRAETSASSAITSFCPVTCGCSPTNALEGCATACLT